MTTIEYKCFYKLEGTGWKHYIFEADSDLEALRKAGEQMEEWNVVSFGVERITRERIL